MVRPSIRPARRMLAALLLTALAACLAVSCTRNQRATGGLAGDEVDQSKVARMAGADAPREQLVAVNAVAPQPAPIPNTVAPADAQRVLIRNAQLSLVVSDVDQAGARLERAIAQLDGFVSSLSASRQNGLPYRSYVLRVPAGRLDEARVVLRALAVRIESESQSVEDVTSQFVDVEAHVRTLKATELELLALLRESRQRGQKTEDIMGIFRELTGIRTQIEQYAGQLQSWRALAAMSTLQVELHPDVAIGPAVGPTWRPSETVGRSLSQLVGMLRGVIDAGIWASIVLLPIALLLGSLLWLVRRRFLQAR